MPNNFNVNIISGNVELREGDLLLVNSESTINVRTELNKKENITNRAYTLNAESTNDQYPTAKTVYDFVSSSVAEVPKVGEVWVRGTGSGSAVLSGSSCTASGQFAIAEGFLTVASGRYSHAEGASTTASGEYSHAEGHSTTASGYYSHAEGYGTIASGEESHAEGNYTIASERCSHAEGQYTTASGYYSHAEGRLAVASGQHSHAEGSGSRASGHCSHAEGYRTTASGRYSHAEGLDTEALVSGSHAEGSGSKALGNYSHAEGWRATASGSYSHAEGLQAAALGNYSHAEGCYATASNLYEHAQGRYNATASDQIFSIGAGDAEARRKNAISIITGSGTVSSASIYIYGIDSYIGNNPVPGTNDLASVIAKISASSGGGGGITAETDPVYLADSASLKASASLAKSAIQPAATSSWAAAATWITTNSASALAVSPASVTASVSAAIGAATASHHTHSNKAVLDGITAAKTASWDSKLSSESDPVYLADSSSLKASASLAQGIAAITASLVASASVAKTASSSAAAISAKTGSYDALQGLPAVTAADNNKVLMVVNGAWTLVQAVSIYTGSAAPDNSQGNDGDIYLQS